MNRIIVALDVPTLEEANRLATDLAPVVGGFKVGMELLMGVGPLAIETIADHDKPVFVDAKLHDIPNTVQRAAAHIRAAGARWVTVHAGGGLDMIEAANTAMGGTGVLVVTMLTSLSASDLPTVGIDAGIEDHVVDMARLATKASAEGVVCSPAEVRAVRMAEPGLEVFTPGVRPGTSKNDDQKRVATPEAARADGADYLVVGRPITGSSDPVVSAREIASSIAAFD